ncbi:cytosolic protein [Halobacillus amylolyticus]|uniref:Cytosolic protein n=1 Tax=Halobacillus amylolyticus TaxID=2932259 RepID=A0ABY4HAW2_9BACI|nr:cytosolic protein [Halobacillus amylolyticus]UOR11962.1 cytosolic protein [Halobacillus amylolyticus]
MKAFISKYFSNHAETSEESYDKSLETHYYKAKKDEVFRAVEELFRSPSEKIAVSKERGEITVNYKGKKKAFIVATVIMVRPFQTSVDFSVTTDSGGPIDFGFSHRLVIQLYHELDSQFPLVNSSER